MIAEEPAEPLPQPSEEAEESSTTNPTPVAAPRRPRGVPVVHSHPAHVRGVSLTERGITLMPGLDNLVSELRAANLYIRPSGQIGHAPRVTMHPASSGQLTPYGLIVSLGIYANHQDYYGTGYVDGTSAQLTLSRTVDGLTMGFSGLLWDGWATAIYSNTFDIGHNLFNIGAQIQVWRDKLRFGCAFVYTNLATNQFLALGAFMGLYASASLKDLGEYVGPDAEELASAHGVDYATEGLHRVEMKRQPSLWYSFRAGGGMFWLAGLLRIDGLRTLSRTYRTMASRQRTHDMVFEGTGLGQYFKDRFRALGWKKDIANIPDPHLPESMRLGDEVIEGKSRTWMADLLVGNLAVWAGAQLMWRGEHEISTHRLDDTHMEVVFNKTSLRDGSAYLFSPFGPEADVGAGRATSFRQAYIFDLAKPQAQEAYHEALEGKLPTQRYQYIPNDATFKGDQELGTLVKDQNAELPEGVKRLYVHAVTTVERRRGFGGHFGLIPVDFLPKGWTNTWARHRTFSHERQSITNGDIIEYANTYATESRRELLWSGMNSDSISAQQRWSQDDDTPRHFKGLTLEWSMLRTCVRGSLHNGNTIDALNGRLGTEFKHFARGAAKQQREVDVTRTLDGATLASLEGYAQLWDGGLGISPFRELHLWTDLTQAAHHVGISLHSVGNMLRELLEASTFKKKAEAVQCFVQAHGEAAFGLLNRLLPQNANSPLQVSSISSSYVNALRTEARLRLYYLNPISSADTPAELRKRLKDIEAAVRSLRTAILDLADDPLVSAAERPLLREHLEAAQRRLYDLAKVQDAERPALVQALEASHAFPNAQMRGQLRYLSDVPALAAHAESWARAYACVPMPCHAEGLRERWEQLYPLALELVDVVRWLRKDPPLLAPEACAALRSRAERALEHLVGPEEGGFPERAPRGVLDLTEFDPAALEVLRGARLPSKLAKYLKHLRA